MGDGQGRPSGAEGLCSEMGAFSCSVGFLGLCAAEIVGLVVVMGPVLGTIGCWAASLASTHEMPVVAPLQCDLAKCP